MQQEEFIFAMATGRPKTDKEKFYAKVIEHYGERAQLRQVQEECAELIVVINHYCRALDNKDFAEQSKIMFQLIEETADVEIMLEQLACMFMLFRQAVDSVKEKKLKRLAERIKFE